MRLTCLRRFGVAVMGIGVLVLGVSGCATSSAGAPASTSAWLAGKGFGQRADWASTALHLRGPQMQESLRLSRLLRTVRDVRLRPGPDNPLGLTRILDGGQGTCVLPVYLNGVPLVPSDPTAQVDLDGRVGLAELDGLELHLGPEGPVYDLAGCGGLLLWDRSMRHVDDPAFVGGIRGRVRGDIPDEGVDVRIGAAGPLQRVGASGSFTYAGLLPGAYDLEFIIPGQPVLRYTARVYAGMDVEVEVRVARR